MFRTIIVSMLAFGFLSLSAHAADSTSDLEGSFLIAAHHADGHKMDNKSSDDKSSDDSSSDDSSSDDKSHDSKS